MSNEKKKFVVPVTWVMAGEVVVEAKNELEANNLAYGLTLDKFENVAPVNFSLDVDFDMIEEIEEECHYCGDNCPDEPDDSEHLCDGFAGDIDGLYAEDAPTPEDTQAAVEDYVFWREATEGVK